MKWNFIKAIMFFIVLFSFRYAYGAETYTLDPAHTYVQWSISHLGFSNQTGKWMAEGTLMLDEAKPQNSKVNVKINIASLITGDDKLNKHLMSEEFFNVNQFPTATFVSDNVTLTSKNTAKVQGMLTLHGVTKPVMLNVMLNKKGTHPMSKKMAMGFSATATIKRSDFGMTSFLPGLGDQVKLTIEAEASKS